MAHDPRLIKLGEQLFKTIDIEYDNNMVLAGSHIEALISPGKEKSSLKAKEIQSIQFNPNQVVCLQKERDESFQATIKLDANNFYNYSMVTKAIKFLDKNKEIQPSQLSFSRTNEWFLIMHGKSLSYAIAPLQMMEEPIKIKEPNLTQFTNMLKQNKEQLLAQGLETIKIDRPNMFKKQDKADMVRQLLYEKRK